VAEVVQGAKDLVAKLAALERKVASKLERQGTRAGTKVFADEIKNNVPVDSGLLRSAITVRALKRKKGRVGYRVTINTQGKAGRTKAAKAKRAAGGFFTTSKAGKKHFYPAVIEYGAENRPAQAPMRKSFDRKKDAALDKVITSIRDGIRDATK
jgi:HK97 gp10 family phage protein